jgi:hypothetical protein
MTFYRLRAFFVVLNLLFGLLATAGAIRAPAGQKGWQVFLAVACLSVAAVLIAAPRFGRDFEASRSLRVRGDTASVRARAERALSIIADKPLSEEDSAIWVVTGPGSGYRRVQSPGERITVSFQPSEGEVLVEVSSRYVRPLVRDLATNDENVEKIAAMLED